MYFKRRKSNKIHSYTRRIFFNFFASCSHQQARKLSEEYKIFVKGLIKARTNARNIADILFERTGINFPTQSVRNLKNKIKDIEEDGETAEKVLGDIRDAGGDVMYSKESNNNNVDVLWIQTKDMKNMLTKCRPLVFLM